MHARMLSQGPETRLAGIWARNRDAASALPAAEVGTVAVDSYDELLDLCEAVDFAVPPDVQAHLAGQAARAGKALMLEKPLGLDLDQARRLADAVLTAAVSNILVLTALPPQHKSVSRDARALRAGPIRGGSRRISTAGSSRTRRVGVRPPRPGGSSTGLLDLGPHLVDLVDAAAGSIRSVLGSGDSRTYLAVTTEHDGGAGQLALSGAVQLDRSLTRVELFSDRGSLRWDTADIDHDECWPVLRAEFAAAVRHGAPVTADVSRGLQLQLVLDAIERSLADRVRVPISTD